MQKEQNLVFMTNEEVMEYLILLSNGKNISDK